MLKALTNVVYLSIDLRYWGGIASGNISACDSQLAVASRKDYQFKFQIGVEMQFHY